MKMRPLFKPLLLATAGFLAWQPTFLAGDLMAQSDSPASSEKSGGDESISRAREVQKLARTQASRGENGAAIASYDYAIGLLQRGPDTNPIIAELTSERDASCCSMR